MPQEVSVITGDPVKVRCFRFSDPLSINGPFGAFQLWTDGDNLLGRMTIQTLFGLGSTAVLNLSGVRNGKNPIVCALQGKGFSKQGLDTLGETLAAEVSMTLSFSADWSQGHLVFLAGVAESAGGYPVTPVPCPPLSEAAR